MLVVMGQMGLLGDVVGSATSGEPPSPLLQAFLPLVFVGFGAGLVIWAWVLFRRYAVSRRSLAAGTLESVEGPPRFGPEDDPGTLTVGGRSFDLRECSRRRRKAAEYRWGDSTSIRGEVRAWFVPETGLLVRAEWRAYTAEEILQRVDAEISRARAFSPDIGKLMPEASTNPRIASDCRRIVEEFRKNIEEDCQKLEAMKPRLLPGPSRGQREAADRDYETILARISLTKGAVNRGIKTARKALQAGIGGD